MFNKRLVNFLLRLIQTAIQATCRKTAAEIFEAVTYAV